MVEKEDELRYLQVELEAALADRQTDIDLTSASRKQTEHAITYIYETLQVCAHVLDHQSYNIA